MSKQRIVQITPEKERIVVGYYDDKPTAVKDIKRMGQPTEGFSYEIEEDKPLKPVIKTQELSDGSVVADCALPLKPERNASRNTQPHG